ncbi:MAG: hypothetical protein HC935_01065 [Pseudanabaena sp. SU_2_4]|nr:hypothetical protein [Pseudanabaena sp. SU_2_4]
MSAINLLDEVIDELEQNDNVMRIKRLILFTCHDFWVNDPKELQDVDLRELIQELLAVIPSLDSLKLLLNSHVKKLSKPGAYLLAADVIIDTVGQLYTHHASNAFEGTEVTEGKDFLVTTNFDRPQDNSALLGDAQSWPPEQDPEITSPREDTPPPTPPSKSDYIIKPFDLRYEIASNISPLRAKVLIFSALHYKFSPRDRDWTQINSHDLDDLLLELFQTCETFEILETKLYDTAKQLDDRQENEQAASLICGAMRSLYP